MVGDRLIISNKGKFNVLYKTVLTSRLHYMQGCNIY